MKLSRRFLVLAAAALVTLPAARADVTVNYASPQTNPSQTLVGDVLTGAVNITNLSAPGTLPSPTQIQELTRTITSLNVGTPVGPVATVLTLNQQVAATTQVKLLSADFTTAALNNATYALIPVFVKTGGGTLQYDAFKDINYFGNNTFTNNSALPNDLRSQGAFSGIVVVNQGLFMSSGYLNQWANYGAFGPAGFNTTMVGAKAVVVQGNATLSFQNTAYNVVSQGPTLGDSQLGNPSSPLLFRLNFVHNLYSGTLANFEAGVDGTDINTVLDVGKDADYALDAHFDAGVVGSIGRIDGAGRFYKTGSGTFTILNSSRLTGDVFVANGDLALNDPNGLALRQAASVNLIGGSPNGWNGQSALAHNDSAIDAALGVEWRPGYLPNTIGSVLEIKSTQTIRNLQALYSEIATNLWDAGPGSGTRIEVNPNQRLTVIQDAGLDGNYAGSINGGQGVFVKEGLGTLALMGTSSTIGEIDINAGKIIANVQSLGYGRVVLGAAGTLSIVQNNAGTLRAQINGALGSVLTVAPTDLITNTRSGDTTIGNGQLGVIDVYNRQDLFYGSVIVKNGITLAFSYGQDNTFVNASSIVLTSGYGDATVNAGLGYETTIRFNDTTQRVNNLVGDPNTRIDLGRGTITLNQNAATVYSGKVTGAGNLVKQGASSLTLAGLSTYYGATVVKQGTLALTGANSIQNTSGLVLLGGATLAASGNQTVGALFGATGSVINLNGGTLTVGKTTDQITQLNNALTNFPGASPDAHPAYYLQTTPTATALVDLPYAAAGTKTLTLDSVAGLSAGSPVTGIEPASPIVTGDFYIRNIGSGTALTNTITLPDISNLAVGQTVGSIAVVKPITSGVLGALTITVGNTAGLQVGQTVTGLGIPAGTTIQVIAGTTVTLSQALTAASSGNLTVSTGIAPGSTITAINLGTNQVTLSAPLTAQASGKLTASQPTLVVADLTDLAVGQTVYSAPIAKGITSGNRNSTNVVVADVNGLIVGQMVTGVGIPAGTTITAINGGTNTVTLSATLTAAASGTLTVLSGIPTGAKILAIDSGTSTLTLDTNLVATAAGDLLVRTGIAPGSVITAINGNTITLDKALVAQSAGSLTNLPVSGMSRDNTIAFLRSTLADTTSTDAQILAFRGNITGTGGLTKVGPERLILGGVNTYTGATNIQGGILQVNWDALPNTSGIVIGSLGALAINVDSGAHSFDRPISGVGGFEKLGAGTLIINTTTGWSTGQIDIIEGSVQFNPGNLASITGGLVNVRAGTSFQLNTPNDLAWTGSISGPGDTLKTGAGTLTIGGSFTSTGTMTVQAGKVVASALPTDGSDFGVINVASNTTFVDKVAGTTGSQTVLGSVVPVASTVGFYPGQAVTGTGIPAGATILAVGANSLTLDVSTPGLANGEVLGGEVFGDWKTRVASQVNPGTSVTVSSTDGLKAGMRVFFNTAATPAGFLGEIVSVDDATTLTLSVPTGIPLFGSAIAFQQGDVKGAGNFEKSGAGILQLDVPLSLTGAVNLTGGTLVLNTEAALASVSSVNLGAGTTLDVSGFDQNLSNVAGAPSSRLVAAGSTLTMNVASGGTTVYRGRIEGWPTIDKLGEGTFNLSRVDSSNEIGAINIHEGTLIGTEFGLWNTLLTVDNGATIGFNNDDPVSPWLHTSPVISSHVGTGTAGGTILKTGAGTVELRSIYNTATNYVVQGGKLIVTDDRANSVPGSATILGANTPDLFTADLAANTSLEIVLGVSAERALGSQITGAAGSKLVLTTAGAAPAFVALTGPTQLGAIQLRGAAWLFSNGQADIAGVDGSEQTMLYFIGASGSTASDQSVTIHQALPTTLRGSIESDQINTHLTVVGPARATFDTAGLANTFLDPLAFGGMTNTLTVGTATAAGHVEIQAAFAGKTITLSKSSATIANQGSVAVLSTAGTLASPDVFDGTVAGLDGSGRFIKTGEGCLDGTTASVTAAVFSAYEIENGSLIVSTASGNILGGRPISLKGGNLVIHQDSHAATLATGAFAGSSGDGAIDVTGVLGAGVLTIGGDFAAGLNLNGYASVQLGTAAARSTSAPITVGGSVQVGQDSILTGSAVFGSLAAPASFTNAGIVAPGYSPDVSVVNGDLNNSGTFRMELSNLAPYGSLNDRFDFMGVADLNRNGTGKIELSQYGTGLLAYGQRFVLFRGLTPATVSATGGTAGSTFLATATTTGLKAGQVLAGTGLATGTSILSVGKSVVPTSGSVGSAEVTTTDTSYLAVGQSITGAGLQDGSVITAIVPNVSITLSKTLTATPTGTLTAAAGVTLSNALTATPTGSVSITPTTTVASYFTTVVPAASVTMTASSAPKPYLLSIPGSNVKAVIAGAVGTDTITLNNVSGLVVGQAASGTGVPANAVIKAIDPVANTITLNAPLTAAASGNLTASLGSIGVPVLPNEIAVYSVRTDADYAEFKGPAPLIGVIQKLARVDVVEISSGVWQATPAGTVDPLLGPDRDFTFNLLGSKLALMTDAQLQAAIDNLTPVGPASVAAVAIEGLRVSEDALSKRLEMRRFDRSGLSIVQSEWFFDSNVRQLKLGASGELQTKGTIYGVSAGLLKQTNDGANVGLAFTGNHVSTSGDTSAKFSGNDVRIDGFAGTTVFNDLISLDAGVSVGHLSGKSTRASITNPGETNTASPKATTFGGWARIGTVLPMKSVGAYATPFLGVEASKTDVSGLDESGQADALKVSAKSVSQTAIRAGVGLHKLWESGDGTWRYRLSADLGYLKQGSGESGDFTTTNTDPAALNGTSYTSALRVTGGSGYYFAPSLNFGPNENTTYSLGFTYEKYKGTSTGLNFSYRKRF